MTPVTGERHLIDGPGGAIEVAFDRPRGAPIGIAVVAHPHPLYGGTLDNKVAATLARAFVSLGWLAVRFNFRGSGRSGGTHDEGIGETDDLLRVIEAVLAQDSLAAGVTDDAPLALAGFSFGTFVCARAVPLLQALQRAPRHLVLVGAAAGKWPMPAVPAHTVLIHGEHDETIPLAAVLDWARPQDLPVTVLPGADHFFHRRLASLKRQVLVAVAGATVIDGEPQAR